MLTLGLSTTGRESGSWAWFTGAAGTSDAAGRENQEKHAQGHPSSVWLGSEGAGRVAGMFPRPEFLHCFSLSSSKKRGVARAASAVCHHLGDSHLDALSPGWLSGPGRQVGRLSASPCGSCGDTSQQECTTTCSPTLPGGHDRHVVPGVAFNLTAS